MARVDSFDQGGMMKSLGLVLALLVSYSTAGAMSNIVGVWIDEGNTLSVQVVDDPAEGPFTAAEIWASIKPERTDNRGRRQVKTANLDLMCDATEDSSGKLFGTCKIQVAKAQVLDSGSSLAFAVSRNEGKEALEAFVNPGSDSIRIRSGHSEEETEPRLIFEVSWRHVMVAGLLAKAAVVE